MRQIDFGGPATRSGGCPVGGRLLLRAVRAAYDLGSDGFDGGSRPRGEIWMKMSSWMGPAAALGCAVLCVSVVEAKDEPDAGMSEADAGAGLVPPGTGVCLKNAGACNGSGGCDVEGATCAQGMCFAPSGECKSGADCFAGDFCIVFQEEMCSTDMPCPGAQMCAESGQCIELSFGTRPVEDGTAADAGAEPTPEAEPTGSPEVTDSDDETKDTSSPKASSDGCSVSATSTGNAGSALGCLALALGAVFLGRRRTH